MAFRDPILESIWGVPGGGPRTASIARAAEGYQAAPTPIPGNNAFGGVPGVLGLPDPLADLGRAGVDTLPLNRAATSAIKTGLEGELDPNDVMAIQDEMARFGVASGMPGSGLAVNRYLGNILGAREQRRQQAFQNYGNFVPTVAGTQTVAPGLQNEIALQNALNLAAPDPSQAASYAEGLFNNYLNMLGRSGGGPAGGTSRSPTPSSGGGGFQFTGAQPNAAPLGLPNIGGVENWADLTAPQQGQYNAALNANPYFGLPDDANPYL